MYAVLLVLGRPIGEPVSTTENPSERNEKRSRNERNTTPPNWDMLYTSLLLGGAIHECIHLPPTAVGSLKYSTFIVSFDMGLQHKTRRSQ